jgi:hypothetical protein
MLEDLHNSGRPWAVEHAQLLESYVNAFQTGQISRDEYAELLTDLGRFDSLEQDVNDIVLKSKLIAALEVAATLLG